MTNRFYELEVFDSNHNPLPTQCKPYHKQSVDFYTEGMAYFQYVCLERAGGRRRLRGHAARALRAPHAARRLPHALARRACAPSGARSRRCRPRSRRRRPRHPCRRSRRRRPTRPTVAHTCHDYAASRSANAYHVAFKEPCGLTSDACCALAHDHNHTAAFHLSPSGCCTLLTCPRSTGRPGLAGHQPEVVGTRHAPVVKPAGARIRLAGSAGWRLARASSRRIARRRARKMRRRARRHEGHEEDASRRDEAPAAVDRGTATPRTVVSC